MPRHAVAGKFFGFQKMSPGVAFKSSFEGIKKLEDLPEWGGHT
jgi:hypothetical protein